MSCSPGRHYGGATGGVGGAGAGYAQNLANRADRLGRFTAPSYSKRESTPSGYGMRSPWPAYTAGGLSSFNRAGLALDGAAAGTLGLPGAGVASFTIDFAPATGSLVAFGAGVATLTISAAASVAAVLQGTGTAGLSITAAATSNALAFGAGTAGMSFSATLAPYAIGQMTGSTVDNTALTSAAVASAVWAKVIEAGYTAEQVLRIIAAQAAGAATGLESGNPQFKGLDGVTVRIDGAYSAGTRTIDALNGA
jgi:hypothetical protein